MSGLAAMLALARARVRRHPGRWLVTAFGLTLATAFAGSVAAEGTIAGDQAARTVLASLPAGQNAVRITWQDVVTPDTERQARRVLRGLGLGAQTEVVLFNLVRLSGVVVRPAAISPLAKWSTATHAPGRCDATSCPMLLASATVRRRAYSAPGIAFRIAGSTRLRSPAPLGFLPGQPGEEPLLLVGGDPRGLDALAAFSSLYRTHSWLAALPVSTLHAWQLTGLERRLQQTQDTLLSHGSAFSLAAPFQALDQARAQDAAAHQRLLLTGGGALAALALFVVLAASGLRREMEAEVGRLSMAGAWSAQIGTFALVEAGVLCGAAVAAGAVLAVAVATLLAGGAGMPIGDVLTHSLLTPVGIGALIAGWLVATAVIAMLALGRSGRAADLLALAAVAALALALTRSASSGDPLPVLLAPLACLAAGVLVYRLAAALLRGGERLARRGPVLARLAFVDLARAPTAPALAIAFIAVSTALGAFALAYRSTLERGSADQAADRVPLDATVAAGSDFESPLALATLATWRTLSGGSVEPIRRTEATFVSGASSVAVPALGVPAGILGRLRGWRAGDGSAPIGALGRRLVAPGPARTPGPALAPRAATLALPAAAPGIAISITAELRDPGGDIHPLPLGITHRSPSVLSARLPARRAGGHWELEALGLSEPAGLQITNGHQNGENAAAATQFATTLRLGALSIGDRRGHRIAAVGLGGWHATGAASVEHSGSAPTAVRFAASGQAGLLRPLQPSDLRPLPVLADPGTAAAASRSGFLPLTVDGLPVSGRIAGVLRRFPTVSGGSAGFVIADQRQLAAALDAQSPGQGRPDELWVSSRDPGRLETAMRREPYSQLSLSLRGQVERRLRAAPISRSLVRTLAAAAALCGALAVVGLLVALLGAARDERIERDLIAQGVGPQGVRRELRLRLTLVAGLGVGAGTAIGVLLTRLAVASVRASGAAGHLHPPLVTVAPWGQLGLWAAAAMAALTLAGFAASRSALGSVAG